MFVKRKKITTTTTKPTKTTTKNAMQMSFPPTKIPRPNTHNSQKLASTAVPSAISSIKASAPPARDKYPNYALPSVSPPIIPPSWSYPSLSSPGRFLTSPAVLPPPIPVAPKQRVADEFFVEFKANSTPGTYQRMSAPMSKKIREYREKNLVSFWVKNHENGAILLLDFETMQQFNVSTGYRRTIRCSDNSSQVSSRKRKRDDAKRFESIDLTSSNIPLDHATQNSAASAANESASSASPSAAASTDQPSKCNGTAQNVSAEKNSNHPSPVEVCGSAYKTPVLCGQVARQKLAQIKLLQLSRCKFVQDMRALASEQRLFNPDPIPEEDKRFPIEQIRNLDRGGVTVHDILSSPTWTRNRKYFNLLYEEERKLYASHSTCEGPAKIKHYAWHGAPADCIRGILEYGFLVGPTPRVGNRYGHGVYLSTENYGRYSMNPTYSQPDLFGFRFMLLCEVLPGTVEASSSQQTRPTSLSVHSGVDQLPGASMHIFYTYDMNVRISPKYLVVIHPPVTDAVMNLVPNELQIPTTVALTETNEPSSGSVVIDCT